jgi:MoaA/NifB/PqqE/SkfB family radical SAM enzyme
MRAIRNIFDGRTIWDVAREAGHAARVKLGLDCRLPGGMALPVYSLAWWLTERCNLRCRMCWVKSRPKPELTPAVWLALIDQVARWRPRITITGGEPSLYRGLVTVLSALKAKQLYVSLNTNGLGGAHLAEALVRLAVNDISISLDGAADHHDRVRGRAGAWDRTTRWLQLLLNLRGCRSNPKVRVVSVLDPANLDNLPDLSRQLIDWGVDSHTLQHRWYITREMLAEHQRCMQRRMGCDSPDLAGFLLPPDYPGIRIERLEARIRQRGLENKVVFGPHLNAREREVYYADPTRALRRLCHSRWHRISILPNGDVSPCLSYIAGNIQRLPFGRIWNGPAMRRFRLELKQGGLLPGCLRCCGLFSDQPER